MTRIKWGMSGARSYQTGLRQGVLYKSDNTGVAWNGLVGLDEDLSKEKSEPVHVDGIKVIDIPVISDFSATLQAVTYPDEFEEYDGLSSLGGGLSVDNQRPKPFGLCYRTKVGNDLTPEAGYQLHILYNLTAVPSVKSYRTLGSSVDPSVFSWSISGVPQDSDGYRPTVHIVLDSTYVNEYLMLDIEEILYGTVSTAPRLPTIDEIIDIALAFSWIVIVDNGDGTWSATGPAEAITMLDATTFQLNGADATYLDPYTYTVTSN